MKKLTTVCLLLALIDHKEAVDQFVPRPLFRLFRDWQLNFIGRSLDDPWYLKAAQRTNRIQKPLPESTPFPCFADGKFTPEDGRSKERPTSVHRLRPGDIDVIGAMGDSLTAANGAAASNLFHVGVENRGVSFSAGGKGTWHQYFTVPNMLKMFNPKLVGYSYADGLPHHRSSQFNVAEIGAMSQDYPYMATQLVKRMKSDPRVDFENDWKLVTMMIGDNDFCLNVCFGRSVEQVIETHRRELHKTLTYLKANLPRVLVNLIPAPDATLLKTLNHVPKSCELTHLFECPCLFGEPNRSKFDTVKRTVAEWQAVDESMADLPEFSDGDTFAVVTQPWSMGVALPVDKRGHSDYSYLSTDCFHFSQKGYAIAANALWNNMMEPVGNKSLGWNKKLYKKVVCPSVERPYIYTKKNSGDSVNL